MCRHYSYALDVMFATLNSHARCYLYKMYRLQEINLMQSVSPHDDFRSSL